jgi:fructose-1,6-bisphosphatase/inositol monophosphatase family enzyme
MESDDLFAVLREAASAVATTLSGLDDWGLAGTRPGQYRSDLAADRVAVEVLTRAGLGVLSEESGVHNGDRPLLAVLDPLDGSTNASRDLPWFATSICVLDELGPVAALVVNQSRGNAYEAYRDLGARRDGVVISPSGPTSLNAAVVGLSGYAPRHLGWGQYRALGAIALDLCAVAEGSLDAYLDCDKDAHGPWDYLAGMFVCYEAGAFVAETEGRELVCRGHGDRRSPVAAGTVELLDQLLSSFRTPR